MPGYRLTRRRFLPAGGRHQAPLPFDEALCEKIFVDDEGWIRAAGALCVYGPQSR